MLKIGLAIFQVAVVSFAFGASGSTFNPRPSKNCEGAFKQRITFEQVEPLPRRSIAFQEPELYKTILSLPSDPAKLEKMIAQGTVQEAGRRLEVFRNKIVSTLTRLDQAYASKRKIHWILAKAIQHIRFRKKTLRKFYEKLREFKPREPVNLHNEKFLGFISGYLYAVTGELGELRAELRAEGLIDAGVPIDQLAGVERLFLSDQLLSKEIDLIFQNGAAWGEVKNLKAVLKNYGNTWDDLIRQIRLLALIRNRFNSAVRLHLFILNGLTQAAAADLRAMGWIVHGPVYPQ